MQPYISQLSRPRGCITDGTRAAPTALAVTETRLPAAAPDCGGLTDPQLTVQFSFAVVLAQPEKGNSKETDSNARKRQSPMQSQV
jgi:hypothetical protein